ncbi:MAG TPA: GNAT family N-acetyltransferase [Candidatus Angelobacter sp.]|nr:GNAT family N-acetyltransferase [Candidatus Angelobacter sp.]
MSEPQPSEPLDARVSGPELGARVADWYAEQARRRATTVLDLAEDVWLLRTPEWPRSFSGNGILVRRDPGADALLAWTEEHLGGPGPGHRHVAAMCDLSDETRAGLAAAGFELRPELLMARPADVEPAAAASDVVVALTTDESGALAGRLWREVWMPGIDEETLRQLVGRAEVYPRSGELVHLGVRDATTGEAVACLDVAVMGRAAEIDAVATLPAHRGRGYADALLTAGLALIGSRGCDLAVLTALQDDWPREWYARRGFGTVATMWEALITPGAAR